MLNNKTIVAVVGLGYVGLPLAVEFGKKYPTRGYDLSKSKVTNYRKCYDPTDEVSSAALKAADKLEVSTDETQHANTDYIIIAVPTPIDQAHIPDFSPLVGASAAVGKHMKRGVTVIHESTVYLILLCH